MKEQKRSVLRADEGGFTRTDSRIIKGIAILMMLFHHMAAFEDRTPVGFPGFASLIPALDTGKFIEDLGSFGKLCVPLFFFLAGYGLYAQWRAGRLSVRRRIISMYKAYWKVFFVFIPVAYLFFARSGGDINPQCTRYVVTSWAETFRTVVFNFIGYQSTLNGEWWFFRYYILSLPLGVCFCLATKNVRSFWMDMLFVVGLDMFFHNILLNMERVSIFSSLGSNIFFEVLSNSGWEYFGAFFEGIVFAKYNGIGIIKDEISKVWFKKPLCVCGFILLYLCFIFTPGKNGVLLYTPMLIAFASVLLQGLDRVERALAFLGKHSTNMWLIHSFYCYYFLEATKLVYCTTNVWVDFLVLTAMSLASSVLLDLFWKYVGRGWTAVRRRLSERSLRLGQ